MAAFSIGRLSKRAGVKVPTIRYYESIGLLNAPRRTEGGQRIYANADIERLAFIRHARELGFSMKMIRNLLHLQAQPSGDCRDVERIEAMLKLRALGSRGASASSTSWSLSR